MPIQKAGTEKKVKSTKSLPDNELIERYNTAKYILNISYSQLSRYDGKTFQILTLIGFDFTVIGLFSSWLFDKSMKLGSKIFFLTCIAASLALIIATLICVRQTLQPHVTNPVKKKLGLLFFMDIEKGYDEEKYVNTLIGNADVPNSQHYSASDPMRYFKCIIEDCARDIYAQSKIIKLKAKYVKRAYLFAIATTILTFSCIFAIAFIQIIGG